MTIRTLFLTGLIVAIGIVVTLVVTSARAGGDADRIQPATIRASVIDEAGALVGPVMVPTVRRSDEAWREQLTPEQFRILREAGTEPPGTGELLKNKAAGVYTCAACRLPLFASTTKFESGTGWPSFFDAIAAGNVATHVDSSFGVTRTEIVCARCGGHLGHVFDDGPPPTGDRYCVNSVSIAFTPIEALKTLSDPAAKNITTGTNGTRPRELVLAGGCFWCVEAVFEELDGVEDAISGYAGGDAKTANYKDVCSGTTKHAEAVKIVYDPTRITYEDLLRVHFATHDPTTKNRQGYDVGPQYRSAIFYANDDEKARAARVLAELTAEGVFGKPIVTTLEPLTGTVFFEAEPYHQNYVCENPDAGYVRSTALPKVDKVRKLFKDRVKAPAERRKPAATDPNGT